MSTNAPHYFTFEEANTILHVIRPLMREILEVRQKILNLQAEVWPVIEKALGNGGGRAASNAVKEFERLDALVREVQATGAIIKDVNTGLVDFPAWRENREVYLCWKYGEEAITQWHEIDGGFTGRQPW